MYRQVKGPSMFAKFLGGPSFECGAYGNGSSKFPLIIKYVMQAKTTTPTADAITNLKEGVRETRSRFSF